MTYEEYKRLEIDPKKTYTVTRSWSAEAYFYEDSCMEPDIKNTSGHIRLENNKIFVSEKGTTLHILLNHVSSITEKK